jgi:HlyD family secretion protein
MARRIINFALSIVAMAALVAAVVYFLNNRPLQVQVAVPEKDVPVQVFGLGTVEAQVVSSIGFEVGATLVELTADDGSRVKAGDELARLHATEQQARLARANAGVHSAEAILARTSSMVDRQAAVLAQKQEVNRRQQELVKNRVISVERAEETTKDLRVAEADHALAVADEAVARAALEAARADFSHENILLDHHILKAPFDGIVMERTRDLGDVVKAGDTVYTIVDPDSLRVLAHVEEARAGSIVLGQIADIRLRSLQGTVFQGRVSRIGIESDRVSEERRVWVTCDKCPADFHLGEQAEVRITTTILPEALLVPQLMVTGLDGHSGMVWIAENGIARRAAVTFGSHTLDGRIEVSDSVPQGASIIVGPLAGLTEGRAVRPVVGTAP